MKIQNNFEIKMDSLKYLRVTNGVAFLCSRATGDVIRELDVFEKAFVESAYQAGYNQRLSEEYELQ